MSGPGTDPAVARESSEFNRMKVAQDESGGQHTFRRLFSGKLCQL
jgi:hypothetical protein